MTRVYDAWKIKTDPESLSGTCLELEATYCAETEEERIKVFAWLEDVKQISGVEIISVFETDTLPRGSVYDIIYATLEGQKETKHHFTRKGMGY